MTKELWNLLTRIEKHEFIYEKAQELHDLFLKKNGNQYGAANVLIDLAELASVGIDSEGQSIRIQIQNGINGGYALPVLDQDFRNNEVYVFYDPNSPGLYYIICHELCHAIQYIFEYHHKTIDNYSDINGSMNAKSNMAWMKTAASSLSVDEDDLRTMFYYFDSIEPFGAVFQAKYMIDNLRNQHIPRNQMLTYYTYQKIDDWNTVYDRYKHFVGKYRVGMLNETSAPKNLNDLQTNFTGMLMYASVIDVRKVTGNHARLLNPFLPKEFYFHPEKIFNMSDELFRLIQAKTYQYLCEVFYAYDIQVKKFI